ISGLTNKLSWMHLANNGHKLRRLTFYFGDIRGLGYSRVHGSTKSPDRIARTKRARLSPVDPIPSQPCGCSLTGHAGSFRIHGPTACRSPNHKAHLIRAENTAVYTN